MSVRNTRAVAVGVLAGCLAGVLGVGGLLMMPALVLLMHLPQPMADGIFARRRRRPDRLGPSRRRA